MLLIFGLEVAGTALGFVYRAQVCVCVESRKISNHLFCDHYILSYSQIFKISIFELIELLWFQGVKVLKGCGLKMLDGLRLPDHIIYENVVIRNYIW